MAETEKRNVFLRSLDSFKDVKSMVLIAMFLALAVTSEMFIVQIDILKATFTFIMYGCVGYLFGPSVGFVFGAATDVLCFIVNPGAGAFMPLLTLVAALSASSYGLILYRGDMKKPRKPLMLWRVLVAQTLNNMFFNLVLNTGCLSLLFGYGFWGMIPLRLAKNFAFLPFEIMVLMAVIRVVERVLCKTVKAEKDRAD